MRTNLRISYALNIKTLFPLLIKRQSYIRKPIIFCILFILLIVQTSYGQIYNYPKYNYKSKRDLKLTKIIRNDNSTKIDFEYSFSEPGGIYIYLNPPKTQGAYYIKANGNRYNLLSTRGIANSDQITPAFKNKPVNFSATFEPIPKTIKQFNLIEGSGGEWDFYGVLLNNPTSTNSKQPAQPI